MTRMDDPDTKIPHDVEHLPPVLRAAISRVLGCGSSAATDLELGEQRHPLESPGSIDAEFQATLLAWPTLPTAWFDVLGSSWIWRQAAERTPSSLRVGFAAELARVIDDLARTATPEAFLRAASMARALVAGDLIVEVPPTSIATLLEHMPKGVSVPHDLDLPLARWLDARGDECPRVRGLVLELELAPYSALGCACLRFEPTSGRLGQIAIEAASALRSVCPEHVIAYPERRDGIPRLRAPGRGIARELAMHSATRAVTRAWAERPRVLQDGLVVAYLRAQDPLEQGVLEAWLWMQPSGIDGNGMLAESQRTLP